MLRNDVLRSLSTWDLETETSSPGSFRSCARVPRKGRRKCSSKMKLSVISISPHDSGISFMETKMPPSRRPSDKRCGSQAMLYFSITLLRTAQQKAKRPEVSPTARCMATAFCHAD
ncbi:hypothetical protein TWF173_007326 [Orbilia oligospora]|nr:hypothetical protein TWF173_007326 [Orbilia oligospora]